LVHALNLAEALVGGVRAGRGAQLLRELEAAGIRVATPDQLEALRLAELRASTGLKLPDCCALDTAMSHGTRLATFDSRLSGVARDLTRSKWFPERPLGDRATRRLSAAAGTAGNRIALIA